MTSLSISADRRSHRRYDLQNPVRYRAANSPLNAPWKHGRMLNMSASGLLIEVAESLPAGTKMQLEMDWTGLYHGRQAMRLSIHAMVTRADLRGAALRIYSHRFRDVAATRVRLARVEKKLAVA